MQKALRFMIGLLVSVFSPASFALGLGSADVRSYLGQPLDARVQLISSSQEELNSVSAVLASAASMQAMGLTRTVSMPLRFDVNADPNNPYIQISSRLPAAEPVIQVVVEVSWSGGRMLREYTFFLDPPTFSAKAPAPLVSNRPVASQPYAEPVVQDIYPRAEAVEAAPQPGQTSIAKVSAEPVQDSRSLTVAGSEAPGPRPEFPGVTPGLPARSEPRQTATVPADPAIEAASAPSSEPAIQKELPVDEVLAGQPGLAQAKTASSEQAGTPENEPVSGQGDADSLAEPVEHSASKNTDAPESPVQDSLTVAASENASAPAESGDVLGPVQQGETLWGIASRYARSTPYDVNQAMLAIQRLNPDAFGGNNINLLKRGAILRMPAQAEMARMNSRQAMAEALRQGTEYQAYRSGQPFNPDPPILADNPLDEFSEDDGTPVTDAQQPAAERTVAQSEERLLQLIPPSDNASPGESGTDANIQPTGAVGSEDLQEVLARTEEELANAQQENAYLNERIRELEARIDAQESAGAVGDNALAEMESSLKSERLGSKAEPAASTMAPASNEKWYSGKTGWFAGLFVVLIAVVAWLLKRSGGSHLLESSGPATDAASLNTVQDIRSDAEALLKSLEDDGETGHKPAGTGNVINLEKYGEPVQKPKAPVKSEEPDTLIAPKPFKPKTSLPNEEEAVELDGDDPETMLDLARAYISMADPESARKILEEVVDVGNPSQVAEARDMMREL